MHLHYQGDNREGYFRDAAIIAEDLFLNPNPNGEGDFDTVLYGAACQLASAYAWRVEDCASDIQYILNKIVQDVEQDPATVIEALQPQLKAPIVFSDNSYLSPCGCFYDTVLTPLVLPCQDHWSAMRGYISRQDRDWIAVSYLAYQLGVAA